MLLSVPEIVLEQISADVGRGETLPELAKRVVLGLRTDPSKMSGVIAATFSSPRRFPSLAVEMAAALGLPPDGTLAFDLQMACSAYPYALYMAGKIAADTGGCVLVVDGDVQGPLVEKSDHATGEIFSDALAATVVSVRKDATSTFSFYSRHDLSLTCEAVGPIRMDGFKVFTFVATEVNGFLRPFGTDFDWFAPHQANPYMVRQLAKTLGLDAKLLTLDAALKNPGSSSVPLVLARNAERLRSGERVLVAGFGAGLSAAAGLVRLGEAFGCPVIASEDKQNVQSKKGNER